ncbi:D-amino acid dehydrogenase small subunit [compost metagenome]
MLGQAVTRIHHSGGVVQALELGEQVLPVERLVLCAGHRSASLGLPGLHLPIYPLKGYSLTAPIKAGQQAPQVSITDYDRKIVYARLEDQLRIAAMVDIVGFDEAPDPARLASMRQLAVATLPEAADYQHACEWAGMRPATPSGVPLLGATAYRNLWLNLGHGALGFTLACASGRLLAELIGGRTPSIDLHGLTPRAA